MNRLHALRSRDAFARWTEPALRRYVQSGFEALPDGRVRLRCTPENEVAILEPIYRVMDGIYTGDVRGEPFARFREIACPVHVVVETVQTEDASVETVGLAPAN